MLVEVGCRGHFAVTSAERIRFMLQRVESTNHNGIQSYWLDVQRRMCTGTLVFGVGLRDETVTLAGITHLIEHIVLRRVQPITVHHGGSVNTNTTEFHASGNTDAVAAFFNRIAEVLSDFAALTEDDLALEKASIQAENPWAFQNLSAGLLTYRFGARGPGTGQIGVPTLSAITTDEATDWAKSWFSSANAALTFSGPMPAALDVRLPSGSPTVRDEPIPVITRPTLVMSSKEGIALSLTVPIRHGALLASAMDYELRKRLSHDRGLIYSVDPIITVLDQETVQLDLVLDPIEENTSKTLDETLKALSDIAASGFSAHAVESAHNDYFVDLAWDETVPTEYLDQVAIDGLFRRETPTREELLALAGGTNAAALTATLKAGLKTLVVAMDSDVKPKKKKCLDAGLTIDPYEIWQDHDTTGPRSDRIGLQSNEWPNKSNKSVLQLTDTHLVKNRSSKTKAIKLADVVLVGDRSSGEIALLDSRGRSTELDVHQWKNSKNLRRALLSAFPPERIRTFPKAW